VKLVCIEKEADEISSEEIRNKVKSLSKSAIINQFNVVIIDTRIQLSGCTQTLLGVLIP